MSPEERQLLQGLFDRMQPAATNPRDREAETLIAENVSRQPYAPYLLSQTVIVQDQALRAANDKLQHLEAQLQDAQRQVSQSQPPQQQGGGSFLGSIFGGGAAAQPQQAPRGPWNQGAPLQQQPSYPQQGYPQQQGGFAQPAQQGGGFFGGGQPAAGSGGFLHGALGAAAGVAGGVLLADSIKGLFGGHNNGLGIASGMGGMGMGGMGLGGMGGGFGNEGFGNGAGGGETVVNNYYGSDTGGSDNDNNYTESTDQGYDQGSDDGSTDV